MQWLAILIWTAYVVAVFILIRRRLAARRTLSAYNTDSLAAFPSISFIVPARNEAANITGCLDALLTQEYPTDKLEILVVDDSSTDATAALVQNMMTRAPAIELLSAPALPNDWRGKSHACWLGARQAQGEWLCFIDADVRLSPGLIAAAVAEAIESQADMLSLHPHQEMVTFSERFLMPPAFMGLLILMDFDRINNPDSRAAMANGQFILIRRDRYQEIGGHRSIKEDVLEDVALARHAKQSGLKLRLLAGGDLIHTRMYSSASEVWGGLTRGAVELAGGPLFATATIGSSLVLGWLPVLLPIGVYLTTGFTPVAKTLLFVLAAATSALWYAAMGMILRWYNVPLRYLLLLPFSFSALSLATADSLVRTSTGRRVWKDRRL
jgi:chlorobactene glucosyltransferase